MPTANKHLSGYCRKHAPLFHDACDGRRILADAADVVAGDRWNNFDRFRKTAAALAEKYEAAGASAGIYAMATGGAVGSGRWIIQQCEDVASATLDLLAPQKRRLADFAACPWSVMQWTASTPAGGLTGRIVAIDSREQLDAMRGGALKGCFALVRRYQRDILPLLAAKGAIGLICDPAIPNHPEATGWVKFGWGGIHMPHAAVHLPGMVISSAEGDRLRGQLADGGQLRARMKISARQYTGYHDLAWGLIEGAGDPQQEIWAISHSAEPGAIDNASGVSVCLGAARIIADLVAAGRLAPPKRSIRMLSGFECYSFFNYLENQRRFQTPLAGACIDSVGARPEISKGRLEWHRTIPMSAGFVNRVGRTIVNASLRVAGRPYRLVDAPFISTLDTLIGDPKYGFPCPWMTTHYQTPGRGFDAYHSSADTIDLLSETGLAACAAALASYSYYLANAGNADLLEMARAETDAALSEIVALRRASRRGGKADEASPASRGDYLRQVHHETVQRLRRWCWGGDAGEIARAVGGMEAEVAEAAAPLKAPARKKTPRLTVPAAARSVPIRKAPVTPTVENTPQWFADAVENKALRNWLLFWADGRRNLAEIAEMARCEYGREVDLDAVIGFFEAHERLGYVTMARPETFVSPRRLLADLKGLGVKAGMNLLVHSSLSALGHVQGGPEAVVDCLLKAVGKRGTVMVPTFNHLRARVYNPATTPGINGAIAEALRRRSDACRSDHTTHPVAAVGPMAEAFTAGHLDSGLWTADAPLGRLMAADGMVLCLGVDQIYSTHYHLAEVAKGHCIDPTGGRGRLVGADGQLHEVATLAYRDGECPSHAGGIGHRLDRRGLRVKGLVGHGESTLARARDIYETRIAMLRGHCKKCRVMPIKRR